MSLKSLFQLGKRILKGKKESATPATGQQQKLITYEGKTKETGLELAKKEILGRMGGGMMMRTPGYKKGKSVMAKGCKLGRKKPTKMY